MAFAKDICSRAQVDVQLIDTARLHQYRMCKGFAIPSTQNSISEQLSPSIGININQFAGKVGIAGGRGDIEYQLNWAYDLNGMFKRSVV